MSNLYIQETYVNATQNAQFGESDVYETFTGDKGELFRSLGHEYGRCKSKVYIDDPNGKPKAIGWVFEGRNKYEDSGETYLREVWVTVHDAPPTKTTQYHYGEVGR